VGGQELDATALIERATLSTALPPSQSIEFLACEPREDGVGAHWGGADSDRERAGRRHQRRPRLPHRFQADTRSCELSAVRALWTACSADPLWFEREMVSR
jgi:hypothetical protein